MGSFLSKEKKNIKICVVCRTTISNKDTTYYPFDSVCMRCYKTQARKYEDPLGDTHKYFYNAEYYDLESGKIR